MNFFSSKQSIGSRGEYHARGYRWLASLIAIIALTLYGRVPAQPPDKNVFPQARVSQAVARLRAKLSDPQNAGEGIAEERLDEVTLVAVRNKSGRAEVHAKSDDVFYVLSGEATLTTGGTVLHPSGLDEVRGDGIDGGSLNQLEPGDVVHIAHNVPHQVLLKPGIVFAYLLIKIPR